MKPADSRAVPLTELARRSAKRSRRVTTPLYLIDKTGGEFWMG